MVFHAKDKEESKEKNESRTPRKVTQIYILTSIMISSFLFSTNNIIFVYKRLLQIINMVQKTIVHFSGCNVIS